MNRYTVMFLFAGAVVTAAQPGDRVHTGDQTSNTVSVIDPATNGALILQQAATTQ